MRSVGEETDIVGKEMYTFDDRAGRSLSMRPEGTAPAVRAYIEHAVHVQEAVTRWFYLGPMFRYERMKTGRYRQFWQLGGEAYGSAEPAQDVELIDLGLQLVRGLDVPGVRLELNSLGDEELPTCLPRLADRLPSDPPERAVRGVSGPARARTPCASSTARIRSARRWWRGPPR